MADSRFFKNAGPFALAQIAEAAGAEIVNAESRDHLITDVAPLEQASPDTLSFLDNRKYLEAFKETKAGACIVSPDMVDHAPDGICLLVTKTPYHAYARVAQLFYPSQNGQGNVSAAAHISKSATVHETADVAAGAVIEDNADIAAGCVIAANAVICKGVTICANTQIGPNASIANAIIGSNTIIHAGVRIGQDGFGFAMGLGGHEKVPQLGRVIVGDNVEIGANTTIDRGTGPDTTIGNGTKIDNLVQIAHNVQIGQNCVLVSHVGISGSTELGDFVLLAGQVGVAGHLKIASGTRVAAQSGVMRNIPVAQEMGGSPAKPVRKWLKEVATLERLAQKKKD